MCAVTNLLLNICFVTSVPDAAFHPNLRYICACVMLCLLQSFEYSETHRYVQHITGRTSETVVL